MNFSRSKRNHFFYQCVFLFWALWLTHCLLRFLHLVRVDAFGNPIVRKMEWYIFHAIFIDLNWLTWTTVPLLLAAYFVKNSHFKKKWIWWSYCALQGLLLIFTVIDHEFYRFMGGHFTPNMAQTYLNMSSGRELASLLSEDQSIPYLPVGLFGVAFGAWAVLYWSMRNRLRWSIKTHAILLISLLTLGNLYTKVLWKGGHREARLAPVISVYYHSLFESAFQLADEERERMVRQLHDELLSQGIAEHWFYPSPEYPYFRKPRRDICQASPQLDICQLDQDQDGFTYAEDCNDLDSLSHLGAIDIAKDGRDQNCDGIDQEPPNIVLIFLESHRGLHQGYLKPYGAKYDATPFLNQLAKKSLVFTRANAAGVPTIGAFMTTQLSIPDHPDKYMATGFTSTRFKSLSEILREKGYYTRFFTAPDPSWDGQTIWLSKWYDEYFYSRETENDSALFQVTARELGANMNTKQPFMAGVITKSNHYPFNPAPTMEVAVEGATLAERMTQTMKYTERHLEKAFNEWSKQEWFKNTVFVIMGDHGFPLNEHGTSSIGVGLYKESTWIGMMIYAPGRVEPHFEQRPVTQLDIAPSLLSLAGIETANSFLGRNVFDSTEFAARESYPLFFRGYLLQSASEGRYHLTLNKELEVQENHFYDSTDVYEMKTPVPMDSMTQRQLIDRWKLHAWVVEQNKVWPLEVKP